MDAFVVERLHLRVKGPVEAHLKNTRTFEKSTLAAVMNEQARRLHAGGITGLVGATRLVGNTLYAKRLEASSMYVTAGDIVVRHGVCGECTACAR